MFFVYKVQNEIKQKQNKKIVVFIIIYAEIIISQHINLLMIIIYNIELKKMV